VHMLHPPCDSPIFIPTNRASIKALAQLVKSILK
jgi:hypothetical protein